MKGLSEHSAYGDILDKIREELKAEVKSLYDDIDFLQVRACVCVRSRVFVYVSGIYVYMLEREE